MANVTRSGRKLKADDSNSSKRRHLSGKGSPTSGSMTTDTSALRRSARETPSKKQSASSPLSIRKSERIEKRTPGTPTSKKKFEKGLKQGMPSPLKRSDRVENHQSSSSSGSKKSGKSSRFTTGKNKNREKNEDHPVVNAIDQSENEEKNPRPLRIILRKRRLDARSYRALLHKPKTRKTQELDPSEKLKGHDGLSQGDSDNAEASGSKEVDDGAECGDRKGEELRREESAENCEQAVEGSTSGSDKNTIGRPRSNRETHLSHFVRKRKNGPEEGKYNNAVNSPTSKCSDTSLQSSPRVLAKEAVSHAERIQLGCSKTEVLQKVELKESTSEGISTSGDRYLGKAYSVDLSKRKRKLEDADSDTSAPAANKKSCASVGAVSSSPLENKSSNFFEQCVACSKRERLDLDSQKNICVCKSEKSYDSCNTFLPEEVHKQAIMVMGPQKDGSKIDGGDIEKKGEEAFHDRDDLLSESQRKTVQDSSLHAIVDISNHLNEDGGESREMVSAEEGAEMDVEESPSETQMEVHNACVICKHDGKLLFCDGNRCNRGYHLYCLDPPLKVVPPGSWHCFWCVKKKLKLGVHSVSKGVDSIWDVREEEVSDGEGIEKQKQYLVKYSGLAHVHNRWIPEKQLLVEAPMLVAKYNKNQVPKWKSEWAKPHRLLQKRLLMSPNQHDEQIKEDLGDTLDRHYEWYVKWTGLGYEHTTWELENSPFLKSPEAMTLIKECESRRQKAKRASDPPSADKERKGSFFKLSKLPCSGLSGVDHDQLSFVNKLREYWHKSQNAVVEDQERILKVILFILSIESDVCRPFLIISTSSYISAWEAEFGRVGPSIGVVAYSGSRDIRETIQAAEFYDEDGSILFQVLLSTPEVIIEDLQILEPIGWESVIVDECQLFSMSRHFEKFKMLTTDSKLLLFNGQIEDCVGKYLNLLSFIDTRADKNCDASNVSIGKLKERFAKFIACEQKSNKFVEYWVPVRLSNVQLEQYCATLLSNSMTLRSCSKNDPVGALRDILISCRKCCDHPYIVDQSLQPLLTKGLPEVEYLDVGVDASGKLQFLDKILSEVKQRGLRVLVLFQSIGGSGRNCIGDILDDFLRQRYGPDSYERVDSGLVTAKKQAALNMFNNKERGRFVFLIENRACLPSIKLSSVDLVILFDSDWNPLNDIRALQKITIVDSQYEQLKVFRLYSAFTVEEKVLSLAKKDTMTLDSNVQNINCSTSHMLLSWGSSYLFEKLDEFHAGCTQPSVSSISTEQSYLNDVVQEILTQFPTGVDNSNTSNCSLILKVQQSGSTYSKNIPLVGELETQSKEEESPHAFWTNLLEGRYPRWRFSSGPSQRIRRKVQYYDALKSRPQVVESDEAVKKRKKVCSNTIDPNVHDLGSEDKRKVISKEKEDDLLSQSDIHLNKSEEREISISKQNFRLSLQPEISKLCELLKLPDGVKCVAGKFLEYIMDNHHVTREPTTIFQALQISVCWSAASLLKYKINHKESLALAKQHLNFECKEEETHPVYTRLRELKKMFRHRSENIHYDSVDSPAARTNEVEKRNPHARASLFSQLELEEGEIRESTEGLSFSNQQVSAMQDKESVKTELSKAIRQVKKTHSKRMRKIIKRQMEDIQVFNQKMEKFVEKSKSELKTKHNIESVIVRNMHSQISVRLEKLKKVDQDFERKMEELNFNVEVKQRKLEAMQQTERNEEKRMKAHWIEEAKSGRPVDKYATLPFSNSGFRIEHMDDFFQNEVAHEKATTLCGASPEIPDPNGVTTPVPDGEACAETSEAVVDKEVVVNQCTEPVPVANQSDEVADEANTGLKQLLGGSDSGSSRAMEQTQTDSQLAQQRVSPGRDGQDPSVQVPIIDQPPPSVSARVQAEDVSNCGVQNSSPGELQLPRPGEDVPFHQSGDDIPIQPLVSQLQLPPSNGPTSTEQSRPDTPGSAMNDHEHRNEVTNTFQELRDTSSQMADEAVCLPALGQTELLNHSVSRTDTHLQPQPSTTDTFVSGSGTRLSDARSAGLVPESSQRLPAVHATSRMPQLFCLDPLRNEVSRIRREVEQTVKMHEDVKTRLNSECEKDIEEVRRKYKVLLQDAEAPLVQKRKEFETSFRRTYMNRVLAEAFRFKFSDTRAGTSGQPQGGHPGVIQQLLQVSQANTSRSNSPQPAPPAAAPPVQVVHNPSALFSSNPVRSHLIPSSGGDVRAPAPHLQPFRPTTSMPPLQTPSNPSSMHPHPTVPFGGRGYQTESTYSCPVSQSSISAVELLMDVENYGGANTSSNQLPPLPPLQDLAQTFETLGMPQVTADVVCLSDDE